MDIFRNDMIIHLKNVQDKYLIAQQDEQSVSKSRNGFTKNAQWKVEVNDEDSLYLKSCYGKYLTASNQPLIPGMTARNLRVTQTQPEKKNTSHLWLPVGQPEQREPHTMWLRTLHGMKSFVPVKQKDNDQQNTGSKDEKETKKVKTCKILLSRNRFKCKTL
ncbi:actin cross-linking [Artemisia annua]|uniref:Actin cross-linking n=1 Tax=Artemisia annua TaxID=35608 RepID=A0A2U1NC79_ARTAN|nr:actin cross-linking [Artemisia annua]